MTYIIIAVILMAALAPLLHFVPTKAQLRTSNLREHAALRGLFVEFRSPPGAEQLEMGKVAVNRSRVIYYGRRLPPSRGRDPRADQAWTCSREGWRGVERRESVPEILGQLPGQVYAASIEEGSCGVYWEEGGEVPQVDQIAEALLLWEKQIV